MNLLINNNIEYIDCRCVEYNLKIMQNLGNVDGMGGAFREDLITKGMSFFQSPTLSTRLVSDKVKHLEQQGLTSPEILETLNRLQSSQGSNGPSGNWLLNTLIGVAMVGMGYVAYELSNGEEEYPPVITTTIDEAGEQDQNQRETSDVNLDESQLLNSNSIPDFLANTQTKTELDPLSKSQSQLQEENENGIFFMDGDGDDNNNNNNNNKSSPSSPSLTPTSAPASASPAYSKTAITNDIVDKLQIHVTTLS